jgi:hypothetical protein
MTPKISFIVTIVGSALVLGVPAAWGDNSQAQRLGPGNLAVSPEVYESTLVGGATISRQGPGNLAVSPDVYESTVLGGKVAAGNTAGQTLVFDNYRTESALPSSGRELVFDNYRLDPPAQPTQITISRSDDGVEWPQIGIGFGLGLVLALGLGLALRFAHVRPLAH